MGRAIKGALLRPHFALLDRRENRKWNSNPDAAKFLIVRHPGKSPLFHDYLLQWMAEEVLHLRSDFALGLLPCRGVNPQNYLALAPWLQDPVEDWIDLNSFQRIADLENEFRNGNAVVINSVQHLKAGAKSNSSRIFQRCGVRTPKVVVIHDPATFDPRDFGLQFPFVIREDRRHAGPMRKVESSAELTRVNWEPFESPIAVEFIDVRDPHDGLCRKYRFVSAGDFGVPRHLIVSHSWEVRAQERVRNRATQDEETVYASAPDTNSEVLQRIRQAMELDLVAFDYSYDRSGELVVWEANAYANLSYPAGDNVEYTRPFVERSYAAITAMYYRAAGLEIDSKLKSKLGNCYLPTEDNRTVDRALNCITTGDRDRRNESVKAG